MHGRPFPIPQGARSSLTRNSSPRRRVFNKVAILGHVTLHKLGFILNFQMFLLARARRAMPFTRIEKPDRLPSCPVGSDHLAFSRSAGGKVRWGGGKDPIRTTLWST